VQSAWVRKEAAYAERAGKYLPLGLDGFKARALDAALRDDTFISLEATVADPGDFARQIRSLREQGRTNTQFRHPEIRPVPGFIGRAEMLAELEKMLWDGKGHFAIRNSDQFTIALHGGGGVDKTVLARHYAWERRERYCGLWCERAEQPQTLTVDLAELGARLGLPLSGMEPEDAAQASLDHLARHKTGKPWLLIYDNVEDKALARRFTPPENALSSTRRGSPTGSARLTICPWTSSRARRPSSSCSPSRRGRIARRRDGLPTRWAACRWRSTMRGR
jgi:hypothetical protein